MNQTLEEIKKLAKEYQAASLGRNQLATDCLRLIEALEKCQDQRNFPIRLAHGIELNSMIDKLDKELTAILGG